MTTIYLIGGGALLVLAIVLLWNRSARTLGRTEANAKGMEKAIETRKKMDAVSPAGRDGTVDKLRKGGF